MYEPHTLTDKERATLKEECTNSAWKVGAQKGIFTLAATTTGVVGAHVYVPGFRKALGSSGKAALVVMPSLFVFALATEHAMNQCVRSQGNTSVAALAPNAAIPSRGL